MRIACALAACCFLVQGCGPGNATWGERFLRKLKPMSPGEALANLGADAADTRREAVVVLGTDAATKDRPDVHKLIAVYAFGSQDTSVRVAALSVLRANRAELAPEDLEKLRLCLDRRNDKWLRVEAAECLGTFVHPEGADRLVLALREDSELEVRMAAVRSLGKYPNIDVARVLTNHLRMDDTEAFSLTNESQLSLQELTGNADINYESVKFAREGPARVLVNAWNRYFQDNPDHAFDRHGQVQVRAVPKEGFWTKARGAIASAYYFVRKPRRVD